MKYRLNRLTTIILCIALIFAAAPALVHADDGITITVSANGHGLIQVNGRTAAASDSVTVPKNSSVTIVGIPDDGYRLAYFVQTSAIGNITYGTPGSMEYSFSPSYNTSITAYFYSTSAEVSATIDDIDLGAANEGYTVANDGSTYASYSVPLTMSIHVTGDQLMKIAPASTPLVLDEEGKNYFQVLCSYNQYRNKLISVSDPSIYFRVVPKPGLSVGTYEGTITLVERCQPAFTEPVTAHVTFTVTDDPIITATSNNTSYGTVTGGGVYTPGSTVTLTATPNEHYSFVKWSDGSTDNPYVFTATESKTVRATFEQSEFRVRALVSGNGKIKVNDGEPTTSEDFWVPKNTPLTFTGIPDDGYRLAYFFNSYSNRPTGTLGSMEYSLSPSANTDVTAYFYSTSSGVSATIDDKDLGIANEGYAVANDGSTYASYSVPITMSIHVTGDQLMKIAPASVPLVLDEEGKNYFQVLCSSNTYRDKLISFSDPSIYFRVVPKPGLPVGTYEGTITLVERCQPAFTEPVTAHVTFTVTHQYIITTSVAPEGGGTAEGGGTFWEDESVTLTATPAENFRFDHWEVGGASVSTDATYTFPAAATANYKAVFERTAYKINVASSPAEGGTAAFTTTDETSVNIAPGSEITATATPMPGYVFDHWTDNGNQTGDGASITVSALINHTLVAHFTKIPNTEGRLMTNAADPEQTIGVVLHTDSGEVDISGSVSAAKPVLVASFDDSGRFMGITIATTTATVSTAAGAGKVSIFWTDNTSAPLGAQEVIELD